VGFLLQPRLRKPLFREVLRKANTPPFRITQSYAKIGSFFHEFSCPADKEGRDGIEKILTSNSKSYLYLTSHFSYGTDARILTLSNVKPLYILYKEIGDISVMLD
jgi:hypothetical protein